MKRAIFIALLAVSSSYSYSQNLVINPGFESWSKINKPAGWTHIENCTKDSSFIRSGSYSCMHSGGTTTSDLGQTIAVTPGLDYSLTICYKTYTTGSGNGARIWCYWKDKNGISISDPVSDAILRPSKYMKSDEWEILSVTVTAPTNAVALYLEVRVYPNSVAWWDDFIFEESIATGSHDAEFLSPLVYPNPFDNYLNISHLQNIQFIDIQGLSGTKVLSSKINNEDGITLSLSHLPKGAYIVRLQSGNKTVTCIVIKK